MKRRHGPLGDVPAICLVAVLFFSGTLIWGQGTRETAPDGRQEAATAADQAPAPPPTQAAGIPQYALTIEKAGNGQGRVTSSPAGTLFKRGTVVTLRAVPEANSLFTGWVGSCSGASLFCSLNMTADRALTASFTLRTYVIRVPSPVNGVIHPSGIVKANHGEKRRFQIIPLPGFRVSDVLVDKVSVGAVNSYTFSNVTGDHVVEVVFAKE